MEVAILVKCKEHLGLRPAKRTGRISQKRKLEPMVRLGRDVRKAQGGVSFGHRTVVLRVR